MNLNGKTEVIQDPRVVTLYYYTHVAARYSYIYRREKRGRERRM